MATGLALLGAGCCLLSICSPLHNILKQWSRGRLWRLIPQQLGVVAAAQRWTHPLLDVAVFWSTATVTLEFYLTLLPILVWCGQAHLVALMVALLGGCGFVSFALKDLLESPRPADCLKSTKTPPLVVRDPSGDIEDGIPSAHCCASVPMLFYAISAAIAAGWVSSEWRPVLQLAAAVWVAFIAWGRMYLGLHTPIDLASGTLLGWSLLELWQHVEQQYDVWLLSGPHLLPQVLLTSFVLMRCHPMPSRFTSCYGYSTAWIGGWCGVTIGWRAMYPALESAAAAAAVAGGGVGGHSSSSSSSLVQQLPLAWQWLVMGIKIVLGLALVAASKIAVKAVLLMVLGRLFRLVPRPVRCLWQPL